MKADPKIPIKNMRQQPSNLRVSSLPVHLRHTVAQMNFDQDGKGELNQEEIVQVVDNLDKTTKSNMTLKYVVAGLVVFSFVLVGIVFAASITAVRLTKETEIDSVNGISYAKASHTDHSHHTTVKTEDVVIYSDTTRIIDMSNTELQNLKEILLYDDAVKFQIKGYARSANDDEIGLLVEGGTIVYDNDGLKTATGDAQALLDLAYGTAAVVQDDTGTTAKDENGQLRRYHRYLPSSSTVGSNCSDSSRRRRRILPSSSEVTSGVDTMSCTTTGSGSRGSFNGSRAF